MVVTLIFLQFSFSQQLFQHMIKVERLQDNEEARQTWETTTAPSLFRF